MKQGIAAVTGGTGFIGRHLVRLLLSDGKPVRVLTRDIRKAKSILQGEVEYFEGDLSDIEQLSRFLSGAEHVFHLASELKDKTSMYETNVLGTKNVLSVLEKTQFKKFIYLSSAGVTGQKKYNLIDEKTQCSPSNEYEQSKWDAERLVFEFAGQKRKDISILRPTNVIGEDKDNPEDSFYRFIRQIKKNRFFYINHGDGTANYIYVRDVAKALIELSESDAANGEIFIINDQSLMRDVVECIKTFCHINNRTASLPYLPVLAASAVVHAIYPGFVLSPARVKALYSPYQYSSQKIERQLGFKLEYGIKNGLMRTIEWLENKKWI